ncbi:MAG: type I-C CRISPR-associated protein Cas8c/Csd1 [Nitrospirae bacterium]|nr:type I-C CRISPR-associated protein Cas8c/Csd1 [Nitrospirota bacterium]
MLNELYQLSRNLQKCGIQVSEPHQYVESPGKSEGFIVCINSAGLPEVIEYITAEQMKKLWTLRKGNHNSFPFVKLKKPIWKVAIDSSVFQDVKGKKKYEEKRKSLIEERQYEFNEQDISLASWTRERIAEINGKDDKMQVLVDLTCRMPHDRDSSIEFVMRLSELILQNMQEQTIDLAKTILIGDLKERDQEIVCDAPLFFDVSDWAKYQCRVASPEMGVLVSKYLPRASVDNQVKGISAYGGSGLKVDPFPKRKLGPAGQSYLFSMNDDAPCHYRYKKISSSIFPVSSSEVEAMDGALQWCVAEDRKCKTWQGVPNVKRKQDLLITYLEEKPENEIALASIFAAPDVEENITAESAYENKTKTVCNALRGVPGLNDNSQVNVIVISKVDEGRAQVVLSTAYSIKNIIHSVEEWRTAAKNLPIFSLWLPGKKGEKALQVEPSCPSPVDVMKCLQNQWIKNGLDKRDAPGLYLRHVYDLYLGDAFIAKQTANNFLSLTLQRLGELFVGYGSADHADAIKEYSSDARKTVLHGIAILAIALYKLGIKKEDYMKNAAFNVGRMLALADKLHYAYCWKVRKKDVPPQLIGNAIMRTALDNPLKGLSLLSERLPIYQAWATSAQDDGTDESVTKQVRLAKWVLGQMGQVSAAMGNATIPTYADDAVKAQILLGYLAHVKSED